MQLLRIVALLVFLIPSVALHEYAHGWVSNRLGDPTPRLYGRLTLDPRAHIDPFWTVLFPLMLLILSNFTFTFGMAKPVPINPRYYKNERLGLALSGMAGPLTNLVLAALMGLAIKTTPYLSFLDLVVMLNVVLAIFNLVPIPPLDGSKVVAFFLPPQVAYSYLGWERYGFLFLILLLTLFNRLFWAIIGPVINFFLYLFLG
jgi:Zn-dependent protease